MPDRDGRSPIALGFERASRISLAGATFFLPILAGVGLDRWAGSSPAGVLVGMALGLAVGMTQVIRLARDSARPRP